jgi:glucose-1-phosphate adenylyltransferase
MDNCKIGANAVLKNVILDKNVVVPDGVQIGVDPDLDRERGFTVSKGGVTVLGKGQVIEPGTEKTAADSAGEESVG